MAERATKGSGSAEEQCAPEEGEYCIVDNKTGKLIKLTVAEKERIFLDALQVRWLLLAGCCLFLLVVARRSFCCFMT
jgi:hypothetical protein